jgi:hypothetical protein
MSTGPRFDTVSFLTDYGTRDEFVGVVKAVIRDLAPHVTVLDLTHEIPPFDVRAGALALARCIGYVPSGVVLAVVDPGVGTDRRAVAIEVAGGAGVLVGPDNGLLASAVAMAGGAERAVELTNPEYQLDSPGATFAGRDVFAPGGGPPLQRRRPRRARTGIDPALLLPGTIPLPRDEGGAVGGRGAVGGPVRQLPAQPRPRRPRRVRCGSDHVRAPPRRPDASRRGRDACGARGPPASPGSPARGIGLVLDSYGMLAVCSTSGRRPTSSGIGPGDQVTIAPLDGPGPTAASAPTPVSFRPR